MTKSLAAVLQLQLGETDLRSSSFEWIILLKLSNDILTLEPEATVAKIQDITQKCLAKFLPRQLLPQRQEHGDAQGRFAKAVASAISVLETTHKAKWFEQLHLGGSTQPTQQTVEGRVHQLMLQHSLRGDSISAVPWKDHSDEDAQAELEQLYGDSESLQESQHSPFELLDAIFDDREENQGSQQLQPKRPNTTATTVSPATAASVVTKTTEDSVPAKRSNMFAEAPATVARRLFLEPSQAIEGAEADSIDHVFGLADLEDWLQDASLGSDQDIDRDERSPTTQRKVTASEPRPWLQLAELDESQDDLDQWLESTQDSQTHTNLPSSELDDVFSDHHQN
eukprot:m.84669 g.84669  ORF g.84669 m.84669 type:complete len:339 (+) comp12757_c0_seq5:2-1018(+)